MAKEELKSEKVSKKEASAKPDKKKEKSPAKSSGKSQKKQPNKVAKYFKDLKSEFKKVVWPTKKQVINNTMVVLVTILLIGVFVGLFDTLAGWLLKLVLNK
ncbi:MAG: preprotein translocase subunit SecE [Ruminococcus sp.]|jgi:preprotein translocase subunit SecE|nr:preprotein translocase subunit SecE [Ruminococcus sp.]